MSTESVQILIAMAIYMLRHAYAMQRRIKSGEE